MTNKFKELMKTYGITYAELGKELNRSPNTVNQRLNTESTFHKHEETYREALKKCVERKQEKWDEF